MSCRFHRRINKCQPGGLGLHEALDRLAYAQKIGARQIYVLGGEPGEHPALVPLVRAARAAGMRRVMCETNAVPFADAQRARDVAEAGLDHAVVKVYAFDAAAFERITRRSGSFDRFAQGYRNLADAGIARTARLVVPADGLETVADTLDRLARDGVPIDGIVALDPATAAALERLLAENRHAGRQTPAVSLAQP